MDTIYRKTQKGYVEIETRELGLLPRLRRALILIDGRRTEAELDKLVAGDRAESLAVLLEQGFIEAVAVLADALPQPMEAPSPSPGSLKSLMREAARFLLDHLGPAAESLAIKLEGARSLSEAQAEILRAAQSLRGVGHDTLLTEFEARFMGPLHSSGG